MKDFLIKKYERKLWYQNKPRVVNSAVPEAKPLKQLLGDNAPQVQVTAAQPVVSYFLSGRCFLVHIGEKNTGFNPIPTRSGGGGGASRLPNVKF